MTETLDKIKTGLETFAHNIGVYESTSINNSEKAKLTAVKIGIIALLKKLKK